MDLNALVEDTRAYKEMIVARAGGPSELLRTATVFHEGEMWAVVELGRDWTRDLAVVAGSSRSDPLIFMGEVVDRHDPELLAIVAMVFSRSTPEANHSVAMTYRYEHLGGGTAVRWERVEKGTVSANLHEVVKSGWAGSDSVDANCEEPWEFPADFLECIKQGTTIKNMVIMDRVGDVLAKIHPEMCN
jgi:hypothetical protein